MRCAPPANKPTINERDRCLPVGFERVEQQCGRELVRRGEHVPHDLDQSLPRRDISHPPGIFVGQFEEQGVLVLEVVVGRGGRYAGLPGDRPQG